MGKQKPYGSKIEKFDVVGRSRGARNLPINIFTIDMDLHTAYFFYKAPQALVKPFFIAVFAITTVSVVILSFMWLFLASLSFYCLVAELPTPVFAFLLIYIRNLYAVYLKTFS